MNKNLSKQNIALGLVALLVVYFLFFKKKSGENFDMWGGNGYQNMMQGLMQNTQPKCTTPIVTTTNTQGRCTHNGPFGGCARREPSTTTTKQTCPSGKQLINGQCC